MVPPLPLLRRMRTNAEPSRCPALMNSASRPGATGIGRLNPNGCIRSSASAASRSVKSGSAGVCFE